MQAVQEAQSGAGSGPDLAVAVLTLGAQPGLVDAVRSLVAQQPRPEVVVVSSGGPDPTPVLQAAGVDVPVVARAHRLFPGAARNLGIEATRAPFVGFLAADCAAEPGWCAARLALHRAGAPAVSAALTNRYPESRSAAAATLLLHHRQLSDTPAAERKLYGLSFDRALFERFGLFREELRTGEDSEFKQRLERAGIFAVRADGARTAHRYPRTPGALARDQYGRGVRQARAFTTLHGRSGLRITVASLHNVVPAWRQAGLASRPEERRSLRRAWPMLAVGALAYSAGALAGTRADARRARE